MRLRYFLDLVTTGDRQWYPSGVWSVNPASGEIDIHYDNPHLDAAQSARGVLERMVEQGGKASEGWLEYWVEHSDYHDNRTSIQEVETDLSQREFAKQTLRVAQSDYRTQELEKNPPMFLFELDPQSTPLYTLWGWDNLQDPYAEEARHWFRSAYVAERVLGIRSEMMVAAFPMKGFLLGVWEESTDVFEQVGKMMVNLIEQEQAAVAQTETDAEDGQRQ